MRSLSLFLLIILLFACTKKSETIPINKAVGITLSAPPIHIGDSVRYLALGDSYTYGSGGNQTESYPYQLAAQLRHGNYAVPDPAVTAFQGWTAADLLTGIADGKITKKFDFVTLLIGVNDQYRGTDLTTYTSQLDQLITAATGYANGYSSRVFVISIPDWSVTPFAADMDRNKIKADVALFNSINEAESKKFGAKYLDISAIAELAANDPTLTASDGLHPSAKMYTLWVNQFYGGIVASFK